MKNIFDVFKPLILAILSVMIFSSNAFAVVIFEEYFPGPALPTNWAFDADGSWSIIDQQLAQQNLATSGHADAWAGNLGWTDYFVETKFLFGQFGANNMEAGLGLRHDYPYTGGNFAVTRVSWRSDHWNLEVVKTTGPEIHLPLGQNLTTDTWYTMRSQIEGDQLRVWVNGTLYDFGDISTTAAPIPTAGGIGVWANNAHVRFDDVIVDDLTEHPVIPEPSTMLLFGAGFLGAFYRRRRQS